MLLLLSAMLLGQVAAPAPGLDTAATIADSLNVQADSLAAHARSDTVAPADTSHSSADTSHAPAIRRVTTGRAMLWSALLPGGGQFYCRSYWKGAIYGAAELGLAGATIHEDQLMRKAYRTHTADSLSLRNTRNALLWWTGAVWAFSIADAYVSASMYGFREEQRFEAAVSPAGIGLSYRF
jgi:TM2 domain-containing membrane protein YozV